MRLLVHNLLMCNVSKCDKPTNYPLEIHVQKSVIIDVEYKRDAIIKLIPKLDFSALALTVHSLGFQNFPQELPQLYQNDEQFLKDMHRVLFETHIIDGHLICPQCKREYPIVNGIPNMILNQDEE